MKNVLDKNMAKKAIDELKGDTLVMFSPEMLWVNGSKPAVMSAITVCFRTMLEKGSLKEEDLHKIIDLATASDDDITKETLKAMKQMLNDIGMNL